MRSQGADILALVNTGDTAAAALATHAIFIDPAREALLPLFEVVPLQLLAYCIAIDKGIDVDSPRNLTKAVLAE
jgi:glucosamine--fructose-6-phosphate aminotransferase (isomerizing)